MILRRAICLFLILIGLYHLLHTFFVYGIGVVSYSIFSVLKDLVRLLLVARGSVRYRSVIAEFLHHRKKELILLVLLILRAVGLSVLQDREVSLILVGLKYDIYPLFLILSSIFLGMGMRQYLKIAGVFPRVVTWYWLLIAGGLLRQCGKLFRPELLHLFGYGPVGDYVLGEAPPLYYRTGPGGMMRFQGIFAGPNNYGFFLVGIASVLGYSLRQMRTQRKRRLLTGLFIFTLGWTVSRGARIGVVVQLIVLLVWKYPRLRKRVLGGGVVALAGVVFVSILKGGSTLGHLQALVEGRQAFISQPWGYGLGMAGPSIHRQGVYLPENHYLQLLLDIGIVGAALWIIFGITLAKKVRNVVSHPDTVLSVPLALFSLGLIGLLVEGLVLHVFEDSMVNYLLLIPFGLFLGASYAERLITRAAPGVVKG